MNNKHEDLTKNKILNMNTELNTKHNTELKLNTWMNNEHEH